VRAFKNLSDPADDEFTKGLTLEITSRLARIDPDKLAVIAPTTAGKYSTSTTCELMRILQWIMFSKEACDESKTKMKCILMGS
jgi:hypothetical protein